ncbi:MAG TPA: hypothetical protein VLD36_16505 [Burkholderiales bacterium]|nr:hypothetical protein [Burkholderiales bacterium]
MSADDDELRILETLRREAEQLLASPDPLMRSQYQHLYGRITALIAIKACAMPDSAAST